MSDESAEVLIIGAGISGLVAARSLAQRGIQVTLLEGESLAGGRVRTLRVPGWSLPIELGAEFVHGTPSTTLALAEAERLELEPLADRHAERRGERLVELSDAWSRFGAALAPAQSAPVTWSVQKYLERQAFSKDEAEFVRLMVEGFEAAPLDDISARAVAVDASSTADEFRQYRVRGGYDRVVQKLEHELAGARARLALATRVTHVEWEPGRVNVLAEHGGQQRAFDARACLVTTSVGVLQTTAEAGGIAFSPALTDRRDALSHQRMGQVVKLVLRFSRPPFARQFQLPHPNTDFFHDPSATFPTLWLAGHGDQHQVTCWAGGPKAKALEGRAEHALRADALRSIATMFETSVAELESSLLGAHHHDFQRDPLLRGAYSYLAPGDLHAARKLAQPLANTLFFAGEALDLAYPSTVAGALGSGQHAARQILAALAPASGS